MRQFNNIIKNGLIEFKILFAGLSLCNILQSNLNDFTNYQRKMLIDKPINYECYQKQINSIPIQISLEKSRFQASSIISSFYIYNNSYLDKYFRK
jgi:hypothetical protein